MQMGASLCGVNPKEANLFEDEDNDEDDYDYKECDSTQ